MKKIILILGIIFLLVGVSINPSTGISIKKKSIKELNQDNILYVGGSGLGNYSKIQDAIDNASDGDTVFVYDDSSPYYEWNIQINKSINLIGEDKNTTIIDGEYKGDIITIIANYVVISGFTIQRSSNAPSGIEAGIMIKSDYNKVYENIFNRHWRFGIAVWHHHYNEIYSNFIDRTDRGIVIVYGNNNKVYNNYIESVFVCISSEGSSNNEILTNTLKGANTGIYINDCNNINMKYNDVSNSGISTTIGIKSVVSKNVNIIFNNINSSNLGIYLDYTSQYKISYNNIKFSKKSYCFHHTSFEGNWNGNYWEKPRYYPKIIFGVKHVGAWPYYRERTALKFDLNPALEPYDITNPQSYDI